MGQGAFMLEHLRKIAAIDPAGAGWAFDEMLGLARDWLPHRLADIFPALNAGAAHAFIAPMLRLQS
jgi:hypothetical protein